MPPDLAQLRRQWQACIVQARAALRALASAEAAYIAAHRQSRGITLAGNFTTKLAKSAKK